MSGFIVYVPITVFERYLGTLEVPTSDTVNRTNGEKVNTEPAEILGLKLAQSLPTAMNSWANDTDICARLKSFADAVKFQKYDPQFENFWFFEIEERLYINVINWLQERDKSKFKIDKLFGDDLTLCIGDEELAVEFKLWYDIDDKPEVSDLQA